MTQGTIEKLIKAGREDLINTQKSKGYVIVNGKRMHYASVHYVIKKLKGKANKCVHCNTKTAKRYEWALIIGREYSLNPKDYISLCPSCHRKYDLKEGHGEVMTIIQKSREGSGKKKVIMVCPKTGKQKQFPSVMMASKTLKISRTAIQNALSGTSTQAGNYKWEYLNTK